MNFSSQSRSDRTSTTELLARKRETYVVPAVEVAAWNELVALQRAFAEVPITFMRQAWRKTTAKDFTPTAVRVGKRDGVLCVLAGMADTEIYSKSTGGGQRLWELGDVFEIFLGSANQESYFELQVNPNGHILQLSFPTAKSYMEARESGSIDRFVVREQLFTAKRWVCRDKLQWWVYAEIPLLALDKTVNQLGSSLWRASFCRYDYSRWRLEPVISSTTQFTKPCFHAQAEWQHLKV